MVVSLPMLWWLLNLPSQSQACQGQAHGENRDWSSQELTGKGLLRLLRSAMAGVWHAGSAVPFQVSSMLSHLYTSPVPWLVSQQIRTCGDHLTLPESPGVKITAFLTWIFRNFLRKTRCSNGAHYYSSPHRVLWTREKDQEQK